MNIVVIGQGKMGHMLKEILSKEHTVLALADKLEPQGLLDHIEQVDGIVDFSHPDNLSFVLETLNKEGKKIPYIVGTTHLSDQDLQALKDYGKSAPAFYDSNYSLGVALLKKLAKEAHEVLGEDFDIEIIEKHHNQKADAPSGTALSLARAIDENRLLIYGREGWVGPRGDEIAIHAIRGGSLAGFHEVDYLGPQERISLIHEAENRAIFANGALKALDFALEAEPGFYSMQDVLASRLAG